MVTSFCFLSIFPNPSDKLLIHIIYSLLKGFAWCKFTKIIHPASDNWIQHLRQYYDICCSGFPYCYPDLLPKGTCRFHTHRWRKSHKINSLYTLYQSWSETISQKYKRCFHSFWYRLIIFPAKYYLTFLWMYNQSIQLHLFF